MIKTSRRTTWGIVLLFFTRGTTAFQTTLYRRSPQSSSVPAFNTNTNCIQRTIRIHHLPSSSIKDSETSQTNESNLGDNSDEESLTEQGYTDRFGGIGRLYTSNSLASEVVMERLRQATVVVVGIGGVGSWAAEALCRSGIGNLVLIDLDDICISNTNRQLHATTSGIGQMKIEVMKKRLLDIHPACNVTLVHDFVNEENTLDILENIGPITALVDAIDGSTGKSALLGTCADLSIPVVTCGGAAGRRDPFQIICGDLVDVEDDRLLASCRRILRKNYGFPAGLSASQQRLTKKRMKKWRIPCVYTREAPPSKSSQDQSSASSFRLCDGSLGTACFVTGTYGFAAASIIVNMIAENNLLPPRKA